MADWIARGEDFERKPKKKISGWVLSGANCKYEDAASFSVFNHRRSSRCIEFTTLRHERWRKIVFLQHMVP